MNISAGILLSVRDRADVGGRGEFSIEAIVANIVEDAMLLFSSGACVDEHTSDQLIIFAALAEGVTELLVAPRTAKSSVHLETVLHFASLITGARMECVEQESGCRLVRCIGIAHNPCA